MKRIAITGAAGQVGVGLRGELLSRGYEVLSLDLKPITSVNAHETTVAIDISDQLALTGHLTDCDAVVHLASCTSADAPWSEQKRLSIDTTLSVFDAAQAAGVRRVVYASSHHVLGMHPRAPHGPRITEAATLRPDSRYAVGKAFGESVGAMYAYKYGMAVLVIRIGNVNIRPFDRRRIGSWISVRDFAQLVAIGVEHPGLVYEIVYGISDATGTHYDNSRAFALGYVPEDSPHAWEATVLDEDPAPAAGSEAALAPSEIALGGPFAQSGYLGDTDRLLRSSQRLTG